MNPLITQYLPQDLRTIAQQYSIPDAFLSSQTELIILVLQSRSLEKKEDKQGWFNLLPLMNDEQLLKLKDILTKEKEKLLEIEKKYEQKKLDIKKKYLMKRQNMWYVKKISEIKEKEQQHTSQQHEEADKLLESI